MIMFCKERAIKKVMGILWGEKKFMQGKMTQKKLCKDVAPVVQTLDNAIHRINLYPVDKY